MDFECALYLSTIQVPLDDSKDDVDRLTKNWNYLSDKLKESNLVLDLLNVLSGLESSFFTWSLNRFTGGYDVVINPLLKKDFDEGFFEMCSDILDIRLYQNELLEFVNLNQKCFICQTLSEEILNVLEDLQQCVSKFHDRHLQSFLGIEKLFNYLKPARQTLSLLSSVVTGYNSGSLLYDKSNVGVLILDHLEHSWRNEIGLKKELLQHLLNVCLESYFTLIKNYIGYSSINKSVLDFFIRYKDKHYLLDDYSKSSDTSRTSKLNNILTNSNKNEKEVYNHYYDNYDDDQYLEILFNDNNDMKHMLDRRYVPRTFKKLSLQVFGTGIYLRLMNKSLEFELIFRNLDDLVSDLDKVYKHVSYQFYEYLKNDCRIFDKFKEFFNYYLFQQSDYISNVIEKYNENLDLNQINRFFENKDNNKDNNKYLDNLGRLYFSFDNMKNLTDSLEYYKYYKNVNYKDNKDKHGSYNPRNSSNNNDKDNISVNSFEVDMMNDYDDNYGDNQYLETLFNDNNLDYRNLVLCYNMDKASRFVFTDKIVYKYKLLFKLLFQLKYAEYWLNQVSLYHVKTSKMAIDPELVPKFNLQVFIISRMQLFVKEVLQYFLVDVVPTNVSEFMSSNYDDFLTIYINHEKLLDNLVNLMFLKDSELVSVLEKVLLLIVKFCNELMRFLNNLDYNLYYDDFLNIDSNGTLVHSHLEEMEDLRNQEDFNNGKKLDNTQNLDKFKEFDMLEDMERLRMLNTLERDTDNLNSLLSNTGYCKMVSLTKNEFEKNLNQFKSVLSTTGFSLKDKLL